MKYIPLLISVTLLAVISGCKEETLGPFKGGGPAPAQVSGVTAEALPGGAKITYSLPKDPNLFYVKAEYEIRPGKTLEKIQTFYDNTLTLDGYGDTLEHEVRLYSVSRGDVKSAPVTVKV